jgi:hypothetical protein
MRIFELRPEITPFRNGKHHVASTWRSIDAFDSDGAWMRMVQHHATLMVLYVSDDKGKTWTAIPVSPGHGSATDQQGMNMLLSGRYVWHKGKGQPLRDYGYRYIRTGGARIEQVAS